MQRVPEVGGHGVWTVAAEGPKALDTDDVRDWLVLAKRIFTAQAEVASISIVRVDSDDEVARAWRISGAAEIQATAAVLPLCFINGRVADLIGMGPDAHRHYWPVDRFRAWIATATLKGLQHRWLPTTGATRDGENREARPQQVVPRLEPGDHVTLCAGAELPGSPKEPRPITVGIDAAWLMGPESGTQVFVGEMIAELARRAEIRSIVLLSESGGVPDALRSIPKLQGQAWSARAADAVRLDILHRPYQPDANVDYRRYHQAANCVALTVLDLIAYDNPSYHESRAAWREYQQDFTEKVCLADRVFAISRHVASRLERQFAHRLSGPVRAIHLGTDHLQRMVQADRAGGLRREVAALEGQPFLLVLGNDFEHKNRDFAVKVFCDMCARGYSGQLVLAGFHLDLGSSFAHELTGAQEYASRIVRIGPVSNGEKTALLEWAQAVLYPTSSEGFGLVPFEAAALGTPTAFVSFGSLREILPAVSAASAWQVGPFADHVFGLLENPREQIQQIRTAGSTLTWASCVDDILKNYDDMLRDGMPWQAARPTVPGTGARAGRHARNFANRVVRKLRRLRAKVAVAATGT